ncbi:hypothetical protein ABW19_dt0206888 [Dactylella cylindrospora]|nr:hypothetical protein ABW19_dt0206888 [Dactylella cylindrospora]
MEKKNQAKAPKTRSGGSSSGGSDKRSTTGSERGSSKRPAGPSDVKTQADSPPPKAPSEDPSKPPVNTLEYYTNPGSWFKDEYRDLPDCLKALGVRNWETEDDYDEEPGLDLSTHSRQRGLPLVHVPPKSTKDDEEVHPEYWQIKFVEIGEETVDKIDVQNPLIIDAEADGIPDQPLKLLSVSELKAHWLFSRDLKTFRKYQATDKSICTQLEDKVKDFEAYEAIFNTQFGETLPKVSYLPPLPFKFMDLVKASAPGHLPTSTMEHPLDWIPQNISWFDSSKTSSAIFWSESSMEAAALVYYIFPTPQYIRYPVSVGVVDGDQGYFNIPIKTVSALSDYTKKFWSGYIDLSAPVVVPQEHIYHVRASKINVSEPEFWTAWHGLLKKPEYGGRQYGMTPDTRAFENPHRLFATFKSTPNKRSNLPPIRIDELRCRGKNKGPKTNPSNHDGKPPSNEPDRKVEKYDPPSNQPEVEVCDPPNNELDGKGESCDSSNDDLGGEVKKCDPPAPKPRDWYDALFDRPSTITLDDINEENNEIFSIKKAPTDPNSNPPDEKPPPVVPPREPLEEPWIREEGYSACSGRYFDDAAQYKFKSFNTGPADQEFSDFETALARTLTTCLSIDGHMEFVPIKTHPYMYRHEKKLFIKQAIWQLIDESLEAAWAAEIQETGKSTVFDTLMPWEIRKPIPRARYEVIPVDVEPDEIYQSDLIDLSIVWDLWPEYAGCPDKVRGGKLTDAGRETLPEPLRRALEADQRKIHYTFVPPDLRDHINENVIRRFSNAHEEVCPDPVKFSTGDNFRIMVRPVSPKPGRMKFDQEPTETHVLSPRLLHHPKFPEFIVKYRLISDEALGMYAPDVDDPIYSAPPKERKKSKPDATRGSKPGKDPIEKARRAAQPKPQPEPKIKTDFDEYRELNRKSVYRGPVIVAPTPIDSAKNGLSEDYTPPHIRAKLKARLLENEAKHGGPSQDNNSLETVKPEQQLPSPFAPDNYGSTEPWVHPKFIRPDVKFPSWYQKLFRPDAIRRPDPLAKPNRMSPMTGSAVDSNRDKGPQGGRTQDILANHKRGAKPQTASQKAAYKRVNPKWPTLFRFPSFLPYIWEEPCSDSDTDSSDDADADSDGSDDSDDSN